MTRIAFEPPVGIYFAKLARTRVVTSLRDTAECLISERWPSHRGPAFERAILTLIAASEGGKDAEQAEASFADAAREAGILVGRKLMMH